MTSSSDGKRFRAIAWTAAAFFSLGAFLGVLAGVGSMPPPRETVVGPRRWWSILSRPRAAAASAVLSAVKAPDARRTESAAGTRFFCGVAVGDTMAAVDGRCVGFAVRGDFRWRLDDEPGDGVLFEARCDEMRADFRGEYGSQESAYPCFGVGGVRMPGGGDGVEATKVTMLRFREKKIVIKKEVR
jgi:hypothetical protein